MNGHTKGDYTPLDVLQEAGNPVQLMKTQTNVLLFCYCDPEEGWHLVEKIGFSNEFDAIQGQRLLIYAEKLLPGMFVSRVTDDVTYSNEQFEKDHGVDRTERDQE